MFNIFKKKVAEPESPKDIIPPQVKSDIEYIERIYNQIGIMWDNGDKRAKKADADDGIYAGYHRYEDDFINLQVDTYDNEASISIEGKMKFKDTNENGVTTITNRGFNICNEYVSRYSPHSKQWKYHPIKWKVSDECKANVLKHIEENILNDKTYESLQVQFCKRISNKSEES